MFLLLLVDPLQTLRESDHIVIWTFAGPGAGLPTYVRIQRGILDNICAAKGVSKANMDHQTSFRRCSRTWIGLGTTSTTRSLRIRRRLVKGRMQSVCFGTGLDSRVCSWSVWAVACLADEQIQKVSCIGGTNGGYIRQITYSHGILTWHRMQQTKSDDVDGMWTFLFGPVDVRLVTTLALLWRMMLW